MRKEYKITPKQEGFFRDMNVEFLIHELKNPVAVIESAIRMLLEKPNKYGMLTDRQNKSLHRALRNAKKVRDMLADLLEVGRSDAGWFHCSSFNPVAVIDRTLMAVLEATDNRLWEILHEIGEDPARLTMLERSGIHLSYTTKDPIFRIWQDETKFAQIVGNLIKNALQHRTQHLFIDIKGDENHLFVEVKDDGPGVKEGHQELIFQRYTQLGPSPSLSRTGHGLGLAGARILARHLGGDITVGNRSGGGASFCLRLPFTFEEK